MSKEKVERKVFYIEYNTTHLDISGVAIVAAINTEQAVELMQSTGDISTFDIYEIYMVLEMPSTYYCGDDNIILKEYRNDNRIRP